MGDLRHYLAAVRKDTLPTIAHCNVLFNVLNNMKTPAQKREAKEIRDLPGIDEIILDSAGFKLLGAQESNKRITFDSTRPLTLSKTEVNISPHHVVQAGLELGPDIMISLDWPLRKFRNEEERRAEFRKKLPYNVKFAIDTCRLREKYCPHIPLLIAVQAYTINDFMRFEKEIRDLTFDGFSMPVRHSSLEQLTYFLFIFSRIAPKRFHLLGTSSFMNIALCAYFAAHYFDSVSFDSRRWRLAAENWEYLNPLTLHKETIQVEDLRNKEHIRSYCPCPVCKEYSLRGIRDAPFAQRAALLRQHNVFAIQRVARDLVHNASTLSTFERFLRSRISRTKSAEELVQVLSVIDSLKTTAMISKGSSYLDVLTWAPKWNHFRKRENQHETTIEI